MIDREALFRCRYAIEKLNERFREFVKAMTEAQAAEVVRMREARRVASQREAKRSAEFEKAYRKWKVEQEAVDAGRVPEAGDDCG